MSTQPKLLVVDDEEVICRGCWRVFSRQGFQVETTGDPVEGLGLAKESDYAAILLDVKMPALDGIRFLEELRKTKPDVPVVLITGYPNIPDAAAAMRLGAADYVTKPFSPEEITRAVQSLLRQPDRQKEDETAGVVTAVEPWSPAAEEFYFFDEAWLRAGKDGSVRVGAVLERAQAVGVEAIRLPRLGEILYQGLPLAGLIVGDKPPRTVPAPVSGVVVAVNEALAGRLTLLWDDPCGDGWIACIAPTQFQRDARNWSLRRVILANADRATAQDQRDRLTALGCVVRVVGAWEELASAMQDAEHNVLVVDAASLGEHDPQLIRRINAAAPSMKVVVLASPESKWEAAYREGRIFYYAVEPFGDKEIVDILDSAFRREAPPEAPPGPRKKPPRFVTGIWMTNRKGEKVRLLAANRLLALDEGLCWQIDHTLRNLNYPVEPVLGTGEITPMDVLKAADTCDRLVVLLAKDTGRLPGSLIRDTKGEFVSAPAEHAGKLTALVVQPSPVEDRRLAFDARTTAALAEHVVREMARF